MQCIWRSAYGYTKALVLVSTKENGFGLDNSGAWAIGHVNVHNRLLVTASYKNTGLKRSCILCVRVNVIMDVAFSWLELCINLTCGLLRTEHLANGGQCRVMHALLETWDLWFWRLLCFLREDSPVIAVEATVVLWNHQQQIFSTGSLWQLRGTFARWLLFTAKQWFWVVIIFTTWLFSFLLLSQSDPIVSL